MKVRLIHIEVQDKNNTRQMLESQHNSVLYIVWFTIDNKKEIIWNLPEYILKYELLYNTHTHATRTHIYLCVCVCVYNMLI